MRRLQTLAAMLVGLTVWPALGAEPPAIPASPEIVAIVDEGAAGFSVRHFPSRLHLYTYDKDAPGRSACNEGCVSVWPPLRAEAGARPIGDWSLVPRDDGKPQWAYKGRPIYVHYHDDPDSPGGDGADGGVWHVVGNIPKTGGSADRP